MSTRKRKSKKKLSGKGRLKDAQSWLRSRQTPDNLIDAYSKRYSVSETIARDELMSIGYYDEIYIQEYEREGINWVYMVEPRTGDMYVVPEDTEEHELYEHHPFL